MTKLSLLAALLALSAPVLGHPSTPEGIQEALDTRSRVTAHAKRALDKCADTPAALALKERAVARRAATADALREKRGLEAGKQRRDKAAFEQYNSISHDLSYKAYDLNTPVQIIFASNTTCALVPETIIGPYYVEGELIRADITDGEPGVAVHLDFQFIDINTCEAVPDLLIDVWHANSTGVYSGVSAKGQAGLNTTFGRGAQQSDGDGVVQFDTIFPGHYIGRANHIHLMSTDGATVLPNGTFEGGTARHIGQTYFDQALIQAVEALEPYSSNKQPFTTNLEDRFGVDEATPEYDPFLKYVYLGDQVSDGLLLWLTVGIDPTADYNDNRTPAAHWHPGGGTDESGGKKPNPRDDANRDEATGPA